MKEISVLIFISGIPAYYLPGERVRSEVVGARDVVEAVGSSFDLHRETTGKPLEQKRVSVRRLVAVGSVSPHAVRAYIR